MGSAPDLSPETAFELALVDQLSVSLRRQYIDDFQHRQAKQIPRQARALDLGGRRGLQRGRFSLGAYPVEHVVMNLVFSTDIDLMGDAAFVPLINEYFDAVLCAEVMEHVSSPEAVLHQAARMLKPGGMLLITVPFLFRQHADPHDYGRYTEWYWETRLNQYGFGNVYIEKQGLFYSVLVDMLRDWARNALLDQTFNYRLGSWIFPRLLRWARRKALSFDRKREHHEGGFWAQYTTGFGIRAVKSA